MLPILICRWRLLRYAATSIELLAFVLRATLITRHAAVLRLLRHFVAADYASFARGARHATLLLLCRATRARLRYRLRIHYRHDGGAAADATAMLLPPYSAS